jgi:hypothetical protein
VALDIRFAEAASLRAEKEQLEAMADGQRCSPLNHFNLEDLEAKNHQNSIPPNPSIPTSFSTSGKADDDGSANVTLPCLYKEYDKLIKLEPFTVCCEYSRGDAAS